MRSEPVTAPLCRFAGHTCAACCWGENVSFPVLRARLLRQTRLFRTRFRTTSLPDRLRLLWYEMEARGGLDWLWAVLLWVPGLGDWLRPRLRKRMTCAFLGFEDEGEQRVGCLLHPTLWGGREVRTRVAFALLKGFGCGAPDYYCLAAHFFSAAPWQDQARFVRETAGLDWFHYSRAASRYRPRSKDEGRKR